MLIVSDAGTKQTEMMFVKFELFLLLVKILFVVSLYVMEGLVLVGIIGNLPVQNTTLAIGFHITLLDIS